MSGAIKNAITDEEPNLDGRTVTLNGTSSGEVIIGNADPTHVIAGAGNDAILTSTAGDIIEGNEGVDVIFPDNQPISNAKFQEGVDELVALINNPNATQGQLFSIINTYFPVPISNRMPIGGDDFVYGGPGGDIITGGPGNNTLSGGDRPAGAKARAAKLDDATPVQIESDNDIIIGGSGNDTIILTGGDDFYIGGEGNDTVVIPEAVMQTLKEKTNISIAPTEQKEKIADQDPSVTISWQDNDGRKHSAKVSKDIENIVVEGMGDKEAAVSPNAVIVEGKAAEFEAPKKQ